MLKPCDTNGVRRLPRSVASARQARSFVLSMLHELGPGFHADTRFGEYVSLDTGDRTYTADEAAARDRLMEQAFDVLGDSIYEVGVREAWRMLGRRWHEERQEWVPIRDRRARQAADRTAA